MKSSEKYLSYSASESRITALKTGRSGLIERLDEKKLLHEIIRNKYDIVRMKVCAEDIFFFEKLRRIKYPFHLYNIQWRNIKEISEEDGKIADEPGIKYEVIAAGHKNILKKLAKETVLNDSGLNYYSSLFSKLIPPEKLLETATEYALSFVHPNNENKIGWMLKVKNSYAGFCICSYDDKNMEGLLYGIQKKFQGKSYARLLIRIVKKFCYDNNLRTFSNNVVIQNSKSLKSMANEGVLPRRAYFNIFLFPLLSINKEK